MILREPESSLHHYRLAVGAAAMLPRGMLADFTLRLHDRRFWVVQGLVLFATAIHLWEDGIGALHGGNPPDLFVVFMYALFFVPVIYASLNFGRAGAIPTAVWTAILALPSMVFFHHGADRIAEVVQHLTIIALATVIATRVDREMAARRVAESEGQARRASEAKYRELFANAGDPIVVFRKDGTLVDANGAAAELFDCALPALPGASLASVMGVDNAAALALLVERGELVSSDLCLMPHPGVERWVEPTWSVVALPDDPAAIQVVFRDVTERRNQERGLAAYARQIVRAQEEERKRIARDLHDGSLQSVVLLVRRIDTLESEMATLTGRLGQNVAGVRQAGENPLNGTAVDPASLETEARRLAGTVEDALGQLRHEAEGIAEELRSFSWELRPSILDDLGLVAAVQWLVADLNARTGIHGNCTVVGDERRLPADLEPGLFRITQAALHNVERHSRAVSVDVELGFDAHQFRLRIVDDGRGFELPEKPSSVTLTGKLGLLGIRERARLLGGQLRIMSTPGRGTAVEVSVPLPD